MEITVSKLIRWHPRILIGSSIAAAAVIAYAMTARLSVRMEKPTTRKGNFIPSPLQDVMLGLGKGERDALPYPPEGAFPGGSERDVESAYGSIRIYEFGPVEGKKVLFLHGISTPCVALSNLAHALVAKGCRVMLMDLFGRGYSDSPDLPHDSRLYATQILLALASSPLAWTPGGFAILGYSFGGGVAADFAVGLEGLGVVREVVLLAPGGLIRKRHFGWTSKVLYGGYMPTWVVEWIVGRRLRGSSVVDGGEDGNEDVTAESEAESQLGGGGNVVSAEVKGNRDPSFESAVISAARPEVTVASVVNWQVAAHEGFVRSFVSSIRFGPVKEQREAWRKLRGREKKVLIIAGKRDSVIVLEELREDVFEVVGKEAVIWKEVDGGHEFPITEWEEVAGIICEAWGIE